MTEDVSSSASGPSGAGDRGSMEARQSKPWGVGLVVVCALVALFWPRTESSSAPQGTLVDSQGRQVKLSGYMAPVTLMHFWATWCAPCITEVPSILRLVEDYSDNHNFSFAMIAVQDDIDKVTGFLGDKVSVSLFDHDWKVSKRYGTYKLPETHLVVRGKVIESFIGATDWDRPDVRAKIDEALESIQAPG